MTTTSGPTTKITYAMALKGDPKTQPATFKAMAEGASMTVAKDLVLGTMFGHVLKSGPTPDKYEVPYAAVRSAAAGIMKYDAESAEYGQHAFVGPARFSQMFQDLDEGGLDLNATQVYTC